MRFQKEKEGLSLVTKYGKFNFKNLQKLYKFQVQCPHPSTYWYEDAAVKEKMCERCSVCVERQEISNVESWENEGGALPG